MMKQKIRNRRWYAFSLLLVVLACYRSTCILAQTPKLDSLKASYREAGTDILRRNIIIGICERYYAQSADTLNQYVAKGLALAAHGSVEYWHLKNLYTFYLLKQGKTNEALLYTDSVLQQIPKSTSYQHVFMEALHNKAITLIRNARVKEAINTCLQFLQRAEVARDIKNSLKAYTLLGWANMELENETEAIRWLRKGYQLTKNPNILAEVSALPNNLASCFNNQQLYDSALLYANQALMYATETEHLTNMANALNVRADIYSRIDRSVEAEADLQRALEIRQQVGDLQYIIADLGQLAHFYSTIGKTEQGIARAQEGLQLAEKTGNLYQLIYLKKGLAKNYRASGKMNDFASVLLDILVLKDSQYVLNSAEAVAELSTQYELQKKENIIIRQENQLIRNRYITTGIFIILVLFAVIAWLIYRNMRHRQVLKLEKIIHDEKIQGLHAIRHAEENERKRIAADLHDNLGAYAAAMTSNIRQLRDQLPAVTPLMEQLEQNAQDIVTQLGDTIWVLKHEQISLTQLADRFNAWVQRIMINYPSIRHHYREELDEDIYLPAVKALQVFLILKECLTNALKHSGGREINVHLLKHFKNIRFTIQDDGVGFKPSNVLKGHGLNNISLRAKNSGWEIHYESPVSGGTRVIIQTTTN